MAIYSWFTHRKWWFSVVMYTFTRPGTTKQMVSNMTRSRLPGSWMNAKEQWRRGPIHGKRDGNYEALDVGVPDFRINLIYIYICIHIILYPGYVYVTYNTGMLGYCNWSLSALSLCCRIALHFIFRTSSTQVAGTQFSEPRMCVYGCFLEFGVPYHGWFLLGKIPLKLDDLGVSLF